MSLRRVLPGLLALATTAAAAQACPTPDAGALTVERGAVRADWLAQPAPAVSKPFALRISLCPARAELVRVDATMPEHRHGMNYKVRLTRQEPGRWTAEGLLWHMPGRWELLMVVRLDGHEQRIVQSVQLN